MLGDMIKSLVNTTLVVLTALAIGTVLNFMHKNGYFPKSVKCIKNMPHIELKFNK